MYFVCLLEFVHKSKPPQWWFGVFWCFGVGVFPPFFGGEWGINTGIVLLCYELQIFSSPLWTNAIYTN